LSPAGPPVYQLQEQRIPCVLLPTWTSFKAWVQLREERRARQKSSRVRPSTGSGQLVAEVFESMRIFITQ
jgi:hypothetical protein